MSLGAGLRRRGVLRLIAFASGLSLGGFNPYRAPPASAKQGTAALREALGSLFRNQQSVRTIGLAYLERYPRQGRPEAWLDALCTARNSEVAALCRCGREELRAWADAAIREDFAAGRVVDLDGWQLAETEVTLCAVVAAR